MLLIFFWYYVAAFCSVYQNSQKEWSISCVFSIGMSIPFGIALISTILRAISLKERLNAYLNSLNFRSVFKQINEFFIVSI